MVKTRAKKKKSKKARGSAAPPEEEADAGGPVTPTIKKPKARKSEALWMMTFSDLSFILMCFFALLLSMSTMNIKKYDNVREGFKVSKKAPKTRNLEALRKLIEKEIRKRRLQKSASVKLDSEGLAVEFKNKVLFKSGSASIDPGFEKVSGSILGIIARAPRRYRIAVEGHTDDVPLRGTGRYRSNWDLSAGRSISLVNTLRKKGVKKSRMRVVSFADTKPKISPRNKKGAALQKARAANRRVVVRLN